MASDKHSWRGTVTGVQPRITLHRAFDQRWHSYQGYTLIVDGEIDGQTGAFRIGLGKAAYAKHEFRVGDVVSGRSAPVADPRRASADYYKTAALKLHDRHGADHNPPPWRGVAPDLDVYRTRGHHRLSANTYGAKCTSCIWGCQMPVEITVDQWNPGVTRHRFETFCYGPKSCSLYKAGPTRKVPGRRGMQYVEEDWVDEDYTAHRGLDE